MEATETGRTTPSKQRPTDRERLVALLDSAHRPTDERDESNLPMCGCGHSLGWDETWGEHVADIILADTLGHHAPTADRQ